MLFSATNGEMVIFTAPPDRFLDKNYYQAKIQASIASELRLIKPNKRNEKLNIKAKEAKVITGIFMFKMA